MMQLQLGPCVRARQALRSWPYPSRVVGSICRASASDASKPCNIVKHAVITRHPHLLQRRDTLLSLLSVAVLANADQWSATAAASPTASAATFNAALPAANIQLALAPDQSQYEAADPELRDAAALLQQALNANTVQEEEALFTKLIQRYQGSTAVWAPEVVGRALGNRGNARSRQGKLQLALEDYNASMQLCPWSVDPVLNRGVALEALGRFDEAIADYRAVLAAAPRDPAAWNNLGNASAGLGQWQQAAEYYGKAVQLAPEFSFAAANRALALYQLGDTQGAVRDMRTLLRRYPGFDDMRAALTAALWALGKEGDAETNWQRVDDIRYKNVQWLSEDRRWPPRLRDDLASFLAIKSTPT